MFRENHIQGNDKVTIKVPGVEAVKEILENL